MTDDDRFFTVGYRDFPATHLPAHDGVGHGNMCRSTRASNCSFFENWTSTRDRMTWEIEVATSGYTCPPASVGSTIELSFRGNQVQGQVTAAHDPLLRGGEHDRVPRFGESYVKDFKPLRLGTLSLEKGRGELTLRAVEILNEQVMDVRYVMLTLKE